MSIHRIVILNTALLVFLACSAPRSRPPGQERTREVTVLRRNRKLGLTVPGETIRQQLAIGGDMTPAPR